MSHLDPRLEQSTDSLDDLIDRLVDGGVAPAELLEAVARLDASPDGWRRCALAFVEEKALSDVLREGDEAKTAVRDLRPSRRKAVFARRYAYAASLAVLAFGLGWVGHGATGKGVILAQRGSPDPVDNKNRRPLSELTPDASLGTPPLPMAQEPHLSRDSSVLSHEQIPTSLGAALPTPPTPTSAGLLAGEPIGISFEDWLWDHPQAISAYEQAALEREGYRVEQRREVMIGTLDDGRLAAVPVDQVEVEYVGHLPL